MISPWPRRIVAAAYGFPIAILGGLIGLGGAEFRLPVLLGPLAIQARAAVSLNLLISLSTIGAALAIRSATLSFSSLDEYRTEIVALAVPAALSALFGVALVRRITDDSLRWTLLGLLVLIGLLLLTEGVVDASPRRLASDDVWAVVALGFVFGVAIGAVSSILGVAGGELIIPTFLFVFGADVKTAGTASLIVSLPTVAVGVWRHARSGAYQRSDVRNVVLPMAAASVVGAVVGGLFAPHVASRWLKILLGLILIASAVRVLGHQRPAT